MRSGERGASSRQWKDSAAKAPNNSRNWADILGVRRRVVGMESGGVDSDQARSYRPR